jgi:hypothetical protein
MRPRFHLSVISLALVAVGAASLCAAQAGLSPQTSGVGLRADSRASAFSAELLIGGDGPSLWQPKRSDFTLYGGARDLPAFGLGPAEAYSGVAYALPRGWGSSSLEAAYAQESRFAPRRYAVAGQVRTELSAPGRALSAGIKYRVYDTDAGGRSQIEPTASNGYSLAPSRDPGYQLQFSYHHSAASSFGLALGRDVETYTSSFDPTSSAPRQLTFMGQHWLTPAWALSYDVLYNDPSNMSALRLQGVGLRLGVHYRF